MVETYENGRWIRAFIAENEASMKAKDWISRGLFELCFQHSVQQKVCDAPTTWNIEEKLNPGSSGSTKLASTPWRAQAENASSWRPPSDRAEVTEGEVRSGRSRPLSRQELISES